MRMFLIWCVFVLSSCAMLDARLPSFERCTELQKLIKEITIHVNNTHPQTLHVPMDLKVECLESALSCFRHQIPYLKVANETKNTTFAILVKKLRLPRFHKSPICTDCLKYPTEGPKVFLQNMKLLLQQISSLNLSR